MFLEEDPVTRSTRTRLRRAIGLALALGVVIAPNALAKPYADPASALTPNATTAPQGSNPAVNGYSFYRPAPAKVTYYDAWHVPATSSAGGSIAVAHDTWGGDIRASRVGVTPAVSATTFHDSWGNDVRTAVPSQPAATGSSSNDTRNILLAASAAGLLLIGGSSLVLMLRRRRAQLA
jgi:hypothetical protein